MKHRRPRHNRSLIKQTLGFLRKNIRLIVFTALIILGALFGCVVFSTISADEQQSLSSWMISGGIPTDYTSGLTTVISSTFGIWVQLIVLFLLGLTAFGCPLILAELLFFGFCFGITSCQGHTVYESFAALTDEVLPMAIGGIAILIGALQAFRFSCMSARQLLPSGAHCGGLWPAFRQYGAAFILCALIALLSGILQTVMRLF